MSVIKFERKEGRIVLNVPYNLDFNDRAKTIGSYWQPSTKAWSVDENREDDLNDILLTVYGEDLAGNQGEFVTVRYLAESFCLGNNVLIGGNVTASRPYRDSTVRLKLGTSVVEGGFEKSGGSTKSPAVEPLTGTILESTLPKSIIDKLNELQRSKLTVVTK